MRNVTALALFCALTILASAATAQEPTSEPNAVLNVGVKPAEPFVIVDDATGKLSGFSIDLIEAIAEEMDPPRVVRFTLQENIGDHLAAVQAGEVDLGIAATSATSEREQILDFSVPFYQGGLGIVARAEGRTLSIWDVVSSSGLRNAFFWTVIFVVVCANIIWLTERGHEDTFDDRWHIGVGQALWWTIVTMTTVGYGDFVPRKPLSRVLGVAIIVAGIVLFGVAVGAFSAALTLQRLRSDIRVPDDLRNRPVAVVRDSIAEDALTSRGVKVVPKQTLEDCLAAVSAREVVAAVHDVALLRHHVPKDAPDLMMVGPTFAEHGYAITYPLDSDLRKEINVVLLELMESDPPVYRELLERWFETP